MKVAIAGTSQVARYLIEEFEAYGHEVVVLTRKIKPEEKFKQRQTDYSINSLVAVLEDRDALVSTVADYTDLSATTKLHLDMLQAVKQSKGCKMYIPSEWTLNIKDYPEQPMFLAENNKTIREALEKETDVKSTIISNGWFADYIVPKEQRHLRDLGPLWPMDHANKVFTIYGPGTQLVDFTSARDVAKAVAALLDSNEPWEADTYVSGQQLSWNDLFALLKKKDPEWTSRNQSLADTVNLIANPKSPEDVFTGQFEIQSYSGGLTFSKEKVQQQRSKYFPNVHFHGLEELLDSAAASPKQII